jgi:hypothetical protein
MKLPLGIAFVFACGLATAAAACGSTTITPSTTQTGNNPTPQPQPTTSPPATTDDALDAAAPPVAFPADHPAMPQVANSGGPVLTKPKVVPVFFPGFAYRTEILDFLSKLGKSAYWKAVSDEYGVGAIEALPPIDATDAPPATLPDSAIQTWLQSRFDGTHPEFGANAIEGAVYALYYPSTTTIYLGNVPNPDAGTSTDGGTHRGGGSQASCRSFGGYHGDLKINGAGASYAVVPQCASFGPLNGADVVTGTSSHELIEAATDPFPMSAPAYSMIDDDHVVWTFVLGAGEVGDMCAQYDDSFYKDNEIGYTVQRSWSNAAAKAGSEPCVPALAGASAYFNAAPELTDNLQTAFGTTKGVKVPVGTTKSIDLDLFSSAATSGPWTVTVTAIGSGSGGGGSGGTSTPPVTFALDKSEGVNGDKISLSITSTAASSGRLGGTSFVVTSKLGSERHYWAGMVGN